MQIRAKAVLVDAKGKPIINPKTKAQKLGWSDYRAINNDVSTQRMSLFLISA